MAIKEQVRIVSPFPSSSQSIPANSTASVLLGSGSWPDNWMQRYAYVMAAVVAALSTNSGAGISLENAKLRIIPASGDAWSLPCIISGFSAKAIGAAMQVYPSQIPVDLLVRTWGATGPTWELLATVTNGAASAQTLYWDGGVVEFQWRLYDQSDFVALA